MKPSFRGLSKGLCRSVIRVEGLGLVVAGFRVQAFRVYN